MDRPPPSRPHANFLELLVTAVDWQISAVSFSHVTTTGDIIVKKKELVNSDAANVCDSSLWTNAWSLNIAF